MPERIGRTAATAAVRRGALLFVLGSTSMIYDISLSHSTAAFIVELTLHLWYTAVFILKSTVYR